MKTKTLVTICRIVVGILFIFSGLIKANDPLSLAYKMEEFFEIWNSALTNGSFFLKTPMIGLFDFLHHHSLFLSVVMIAFEIIAGAALLVGWRIKLFSWLLLLLIVFFTFLTAYAFLATNPDGSPKFKNCGCFGDCLPIPPLASFLKDIILTHLIVFLFIKRKWIQPAFPPRLSTILMLLVTLFSFGIQWYMLNYLPALDCLPYKKGKNITEQMKMPANAIPDSAVITFVYEKQGKQVEFTADKFPADFDSSYKFVSRYDKIIRKGRNNEPPIKGFILKGVSDQDSTTVILSQPYAILVYIENFQVPFSKWQKDIVDLSGAAKQKNIPVYVVTSRMSEVQENFRNTPLATIPVFTSDNTAVRTAARTSPCIYVLQQGTILGKWSYRRTSGAISEVKSLAAQPMVPVTTTDTLPVLPDSIKTN